ncbi:MAG: flagellar biosynthesis protein FlhB [Candidatus Sericytochromatia bacterium]
MSDSEKTEDPTPKRRREAREKGQVLKSKEVNTAALVLISAYSLSWFGPEMYRKLFKLFTQTFEELPYVRLSQGVFLKYFFRFVLIMIFISAPILLSVALVAFIVEIIQVGILFTTKTLTPDLNKINPLKGFKRIFSLKSVVELVKGFVKTVVIGWVAYTVLRDNIALIMQTLREPPVVAFNIAGFLVLKIAKKVAGAMIIIACLDYFYQRWEFEKSLKMSKQEVKDEYKQTEGDPHIKAKQRQKQRQIARGQVRSAVQDSSAVVSNPTHYAIAIKYKPEMDAPLVKAKGVDAAAIFIKQIAEEHNITIVEDVELARALFPVCKVDKEIPPEFYMAIAQIVAKILKKKEIAELNKILKKGNSMARRKDGKRDMNDFSGLGIPEIANNDPFGVNQNKNPNDPNNSNNKPSGPSSIFD